jgi:hypothetical protein
MLIITCSFRSFNGGINDPIQRNFIKSVKNQKIPVHLVAVQFGESNVEEELSGLKYTYLEFTGPWSFSKVLSAAHDLFSNDDVVHTSVDVILPHNFSSNVSSALLQSDYCTSWPYSTIGTEVSELDKARKSTCLDLIAFSKRILPKVVMLTTEFPNIEWGLFEHQAVCFGYLSSGRKRGINLYPQIQIERQETPHIELGETTAVLKEKWRANHARWKPWLELSMYRTLWLSIFWVLLKFRKTPFRLQIWLWSNFVKHAINSILRSKPWGFEIRN